MSGRPPLRLVIDTNVALDLLVFADRQAAPILAAVESGRALWLTATSCRDELRRVLAYPELKLPAATQSAVFQRYQELAAEPAAQTLRPVPAELPRCRDADDQPFLELAATAGAHLLISRDRELLRLHKRAHALLPQLEILQPKAATARIEAIGTGEGHADGAVHPAQC